MPIIRDIIYGAVRQGASLSTLCEPLGLDTRDLADSNKVMDFERAYKSWELAVRETKDPLLGLHLGEKASPSILGLVGHLMQSSRTLKSAFEKVCEHNRVVTDMFTYRLRASAGEVTLLYEPASLWLSVSPASARHAVEQAMAGTLRVFELLGGAKIYPEKALSTFPKPHLIKEYQRVFNCPLSFSARLNALVFRKEVLDHAVTSYDQSLFSLFDDLLQERARHRSNEHLFSAAVAEVVTTEFRGIVPPLEIISSHFHMTPRTFQRKLAGEGKTYRQLASELKKQLAIKFLKKRNKKVDEIAMLLGYSESSAFQRAFKSWTEVTPGKLRRSA